MRKQAAAVLALAGFVAVIVAVALVVGKDSQEPDELVPLELHWGPHSGLDVATQDYFQKLQHQLRVNEARKTQLALANKQAHATDVLQLAPPIPANYKHTGSIRGGVLFGANSKNAARNVVKAVAADAEQLANLNSFVTPHHQEEQFTAAADADDAEAPHTASRPASWASGSDSDIYNLAEARLNDNALGPLSSEKSAKSVQHLSISSLQARLAADRKREEMDRLELERAGGAGAGAGAVSIERRNQLVSLAAKSNAAASAAASGAASQQHKNKGASAAFAGAMKKPTGAKSSSSSSKKGGKNDSEIKKTAALMRSVSKILGRHVPKHAYIRPMSTALVARELGDAIDKHERCRRKLEVAEHHLMAVEEKAKTAMSEARAADSGMAKALGMVKKAEDLVEKAREEHENYVQDVRDSLDVRNQYSTEAMEAHTLLEHMTRLKNRYDKAVQALTRDQLKYNKILRKVEGQTDKETNVKQEVNDERAELSVLNGQSPQDEDGLTLDASNPQEEELAQEASNIVGGDDGITPGQSKLDRLKTRAAMLNAKAESVLSQLPQIEVQAQKDKQIERRDNQMLIEAENDRVLSKNRLGEGGVSAAKKQALGEIVERDNQRITSLRMSLQTARAQLRAARKAEAMGPQLQQEARSAMQEARKDAKATATRAFTRTYNAFGLGGMLASAVSPDLAEKVAAQVFGIAGSTKHLQQQYLSNTEMLAQDSQTLVKLRADAKQLRSEMKIKRQIANDARKDYEIARNRYEHAARKTQPLSAELHDRSKGILESRQNAEVALQKAQEHLVNTRRTARFAATAKLQADRYLRRVRKNLYDKQEVVKNLAQCQRGAWFKIKDLTDTAKLHRMIGDGETDMDWTSPSDLESSAA